MKIDLLVQQLPLLSAILDSLGKVMDEYLWFWLVTALFIGLGDILWVVFLRRGPRRKKADKLDAILFEREDEHHS